MRITFSYLFVTILDRYGALLLFFASAIVSLMALLYISKARELSHSTTMVAVAIFVSSVALELAIASAAWQSWTRLLQVLRAALSIRPPASGPFAVDDAKVALGPLPNAHVAPSEPIFVHFFYPIDANFRPSTADPPWSGRPNAITGLARAELPYRLVLLAPGLYGTPSSMALVARNIASHGYVVAGIDDPARDAPTSGATGADEEIRLRPFDFSSAEALAATMHRSGLRAERIALRAQAALNRIDAYVENSPWLRNRIDLKRVGFVGFSFGGAGAAESSFMEPRIAAIANLDGSLFGRAAESPVEIPYLLMHSDFSPKVLHDPRSPRRYEYMLDQNDLRLIEAQASRPESHLFIIRGSFHESFVDPTVGLKNLIKWLLLDPYRAHAIINAYLVGFLDSYLKDDRRGLLGANDPRYPEVQTFCPRS